MKKYLILYSGYGLNSEEFDTLEEVAKWAAEQYWGSGVQGDHVSKSTGFKLIGIYEIKDLIREVDLDAYGYQEEKERVRLERIEAHKETERFLRVREEKETREKELKLLEELLRKYPNIK